MQRLPSLSPLVMLMGLAAASPPASAWGDQGHKVVALIADHYLEAAVKQKVTALLAEDATGLTPTTGIADEASWADRFRDSDRNTTKVRYHLTSEWHYVDIELDGSADVDAACFGHPAPSPKASDGPAQACVIDRINAFAAELKDPATDPAERRVALQFLLHLVGDLHQPLHSSDDHDKGGNDKKARFTNRPVGSLHHYWDTEFVARLGNNPAKIARQLINTTSAGQLNAWSRGTPATWATQSFELAKLRTYAELGSPDANGEYALSASYVANATNTCARQLARAGVRLAKVLNEALR